MTADVTSKPAVRDAPKKVVARRDPNRRRARDLLVIVPTFAILLVIVFPVLWMVFTSLRPTTALAARLPWSRYFDGLGFGAYGRLFGNSDFARYIGNSLLVSAVSTCCTVVLASLAAYALSRFVFRLRRTVLMVVLATQLLPFVVLITPIYLSFGELGLLNSYVGLIIVYTAMTLPLAIYLLMGYFDTIPLALDEAARIDGCSNVGVIFRVVFPIALPGIVTVIVTTFIATWEEYFFASVLNTSEDLKTVQVGLSSFFGEYTSDWGVIMAAATVATIPTIVLFSIVQKRLVAGMAAGSVKE
ncbi:carbohydrate ABC transporter permease [Actinoallomurus iriomotensis]|jgi:ABC-type glycerol-3-phosphate transport system permease component|uniref:ABC transporter permease n=1 Tax=Actinoallomurus iriomotensis TaxID=478107 RepID=A0A9W6RMK0_9ACTN|nr:carbohydrate ABC transporter permease [Actinoallomurus iriomotensis]GLY78986.1 ABC transporter permease [Actinoallomurus iriomotensis]